MKGFGNVSPRRLEIHEGNFQKSLDQLSSKRFHNQTTTFKERFWNIFC